MRPITFLLFFLLSSATSSPLLISTPAPHLSSQISPPFSSPSSHSLSVTPSTSEGLTEEDSCHITLSPPILVVRFEDPVTVNCSVQKTGFFPLGWAGIQAPPEATMDCFQVWSVDRMTEWSLKPSCYTLTDNGGPCHVNLSLVVYKPPDNVSISLVNHTGPMLEGLQYTLQCTVEDVAPLKNLIVTFYREQTALDHLQSSKTTLTPVNKTFTLNITASNEDDGVHYWCEAKLELGPKGPPQPPVMTSQKLTTTVLFGPQIVCPTKLQVREGERLGCEVRGNPRPSVTWFRGGQVVALPSNSSRKHAGIYTVIASGHLGQKNLTVEVEVLNGPHGAANSCHRHFLLAVLLIQMINWV